MQGRKLKSHAEKKILGFPGKRFERKAPKSETVKAPSYLSATAKKIFDRTAPGVMGMKVAHVDQLADYCQCLARLIAVEKKITREGIMRKGQKKNMVKNPLLQISREYRAAVQRWAAEFGLTPAGAMRLGAKLDDGPDSDGILD